MSSDTKSSGVTAPGSQTPPAPPAPPAPPGSQTTSSGLQTTSSEFQLPSIRPKIQMYNKLSTTNAPRSEINQTNRSDPSLTDYIQPSFTPQSTPRGLNENEAFPQIITNLYVDLRKLLNTYLTVDDDLQQKWLSNTNLEFDNYPSDAFDTSVLHIVDILKEILYKNAFNYDSLSELNDIFNKAFHFLMELIISLLSYENKITPGLVESTFFQANIDEKIKFFQDISLNTSKFTFLIQTLIESDKKLLNFYKKNKKNTKVNLLFDEIGKLQMEVLISLIDKPSNILDVLTGILTEKLNTVNRILSTKRVTDDARVASEKNDQTEIQGASESKKEGQEGGNIKGGGVSDSFKYKYLKYKHKYELLKSNKYQ
jgi:hypothetical protein